MGKAVKAMAYASMAGGLVIVAYGALDMSLSMMLIGAGFLTTGVFTRSMMWETKDISEKLFDGQRRILEAIQGPPELDKDGKPVDKGNLMDKMDELIAAVNRLADKNP